jgi:hypothetical protein
MWIDGYLTSDREGCRSIHGKIFPLFSHSMKEAVGELSFGVTRIAECRSPTFLLQISVQDHAYGHTARLSFPRRGLGVILYVRNENSPPDCPENRSCSDLPLNGPHFLCFRAFRLTRSILGLTTIRGLIITVGIDDSEHLEISCSTSVRRCIKPSEAVHGN